MKKNSQPNDNLLDNNTPQKHEEEELSDIGEKQKLIK